MILIVMPAYNEASVLGDVIGRIPSSIASMPVKSLVVDDGSMDPTSDVARRHGAMVVSHLTNLGTGVATRTGFCAAIELDADIIVTMDADGQHDPADIERLVRCLVDEELDIVIGNRLSNPDGMPLYRIGVNLLMNLVTFALSGLFVPDSQSGFKAVRRDALKAMTLNGLGYEICSEIIGEIASKDLRCKFVPVRAIYTDYSRRKGQRFLNGVNVVLSLFSRVLRRV